jgi:hypothetical protein
MIRPASPLILVARGAYIFLKRYRTLADIVQTPGNRGEGPQAENIPEFERLFSNSIKVMGQ